MMTAEICNTRALRALQRRYIPIGLDRGESRAVQAANRAAVGEARGKAAQRFVIAQRPEEHRRIAGTAARTTVDSGVADH
jgi:hypothetical protein